MGGEKKGQSKEMEENGLLLRWIESGANQLVKISIGRRLEKGHPNRLDIYLLSWYIFLISLIVIIIFIHIGMLAETVLIAILSYHLLEIGVTNFDSVFVQVMQRKRHRSIPRLFSLVLANYIEVILIFGIIFDLLYDQQDIIQSFNYSVSLATLSGTSFNNPTPALNIAGIIEMMLGIFFATGAIAAIANYIGSEE